MKEALPADGEQDKLKAIAETLPRTTRAVVDRLSAHRNQTRPG